jgi:hypothetical protein
MTPEQVAEIRRSIAHTGLLTGSIALRLCDALEEAQRKKESAVQQLRDNIQRLLDENERLQADARRMNALERWMNAPQHSVSLESSCTKDYDPCVLLRLDQDFFADTVREVADAAIQTEQEREENAPQSRQD